MFYYANSEIYLKAVLVRIIRVLSMPIKRKILEMLYNSPLEVSINMKLRYLPVVAKLKRLRKQNKKLKVLEVGSGSKGITRFFRYPVTGMDIEFQDHKNKYLKEIKGSATKKFPFKNDEFDAVIAVDSIEHFPKQKRPVALKEMLRVSKKHIIITAPFKITRWDRRVLKKWPNNSATYINVKEHLDSGFPDESEIKSVFKKCRINRVYGIHSALEYFIKLLEMSIAGKVFSRSVLKLFLPIFALIKGESRRCYFIEKI